MTDEHGDPIDFYTKTDTDEKFATKTDLSNTVVSIGSVYLSKDDASSKYLSKDSAKETYATISGVADTYITKDDAETAFANSDTVQSLEIDIDALLARIQVLEDKASMIGKTSIEEVSLASDNDSALVLDDDTKDYIVSGTLAKSVTSTIVGKSLILEDAELGSNSRLTVTASDVDLKNVTVSGSFTKSLGNTVISIKNAEYVTIKNMTFDDTYNGYNTIEIGESGDVLSKSVLIEGCNFYGRVASNAITIFGTQDSCVVNVNNCYFENVSNPIRVSNRTNVSSVYNITNCEVKKWDSNEEYGGLVVFQDYTSSTAEEAKENNLFGDGKIVVNVSGCSVPSGCDNSISSGKSQIAYIYWNVSGIVKDEAYFPILNIY
jgi:hypothetical protein